MLDLPTVGPKFTQPACRATAEARPVYQYLLPAPDQTSAANPPAAVGDVETGQTDGHPTVM